MNTIHLQILGTLILFLLLFAGNMIFRAVLRRLDKRIHFALQRKKIIYKIVHLFIFILAIVGLIAIWGVDPQQLFLFLTSILTILAIGFVAQWSILSNITASLILFFNHPIHIGGWIKIMDKEMPIEGMVENITLFFMYIRTTEGELLSVPCNLVLQKTIAANAKAPTADQNQSAN
ncbi:MAG: mechanosensitive ion channel family protein [Bacteroidetes bacterium]|nr:mechanosensitive ion channel family protein [Bacteroidota bacterium]MBU1578988.1 mechanosensitive ion channel family protein [Bacteroidota bacterium]MBU2465007.1 mechanosensitive ion channel family protein [Bacteroidota bacterium]MBU2558658.1 mechanosensitive ion channel family protein [Bacteroidota bacterium]